MYILVKDSNDYFLSFFRLVLRKYKEQWWWWGCLRTTCTVTVAGTYWAAIHVFTKVLLDYVFVSRPRDTLCR